MRVTVLLSLIFVAMVQYFRDISKNEDSESWIKWCNPPLRLNFTKTELLCIKLRVKWINRVWTDDVMYRAHISIVTCYNCTRSSMHPILETLPCPLQIGAFVKIFEGKSIINFWSKIRISLWVQNSEVLKKMWQAFVVW